MNHRTGASAPVLVHRNLALPGGRGFTIRALHGTVLEHAHWLLLADVEFVIDADRKASGDRVHAFARGVLVDRGFGTSSPYRPEGNLVGFTPADERGFYLVDTGTAVHQAERAVGLHGMLYV